MQANKQEKPESQKFVESTKLLDTNTTKPSSLKDIPVQVANTTHRKWKVPSACPNPDPGTQDRPVSFSSSRQ